MLWSRLCGYTDKIYSPGLTSEADWATAQDADDTIFAYLCKLDAVPGRVSRIGKAKG
jgi:hypothetical protein